MSKTIELTKAQCLADQDYAAIENRDHAILQEYLDGNRSDSIQALAGRIGCAYGHLRRVAALHTPLSEDLAAKINADLDLDLWGVPSQKGKRIKGRAKRKVVVYEMDC